MIKKNVKVLLLGVYTLVGNAKMISPLNAGMTGRLKTSLTDLEEVEKAPVSKMLSGKPNASEQFGLLHDPQEFNSWALVDDLSSMYITNSNNSYVTGNKSADEASLAITDFGKKTISGSNAPVGDYKLLMPSFCALHAPEPVMKIKGRRIRYDVTDLQNLYNNPDQIVPGFSKDLETYKANPVSDGANYRLDFNNSENPITINRLMGANQALKVATATTDGVVVDTGVGVEGASGENLYKHLRLLASKSEIGGGQRSNALADTLFGRNMSLLGFASASCPLPTDTYFMEDNAATINDYTSADVSDYQSKLSLLEMWNAVKQNFTEKDNALPLIGKADEAERQSMKNGYTSIDILEREQAGARTLGIAREVTPYYQVDGGAVNPLSRDTIYLPSKMPEKMDYQDVLKAMTIADFNALDTVNIVTPVNNALDTITETTADTDIDQALSTETNVDVQTALRFMKEAYKFNSGTFGTTEELAALKSKARVLVAMVKKTEGYAKVMDPSSTWNDELLDASIRAAQSAKLGLFVPGKKMVLDGGADATFANNKNFYLPDLDEARKGSTFGTVGNSTLNSDALRAYMLLIDSTRMFGDDFYAALDQSYVTDVTINGKTMKGFSQAAYDSASTVLGSITFNVLEGVNYDDPGMSPQAYDLTQLAANAHNVMYVKSVTVGGNTSSAGKYASWRSSPFEYALNSLRYAYDTCQARFHAVYSQLEAGGGAGFTQAPRFFGQLFMYGGELINTHARADDLDTTGFVTGSSAWSFGNVDTASTELDAKQLMPLAIVPTAVRGTDPITYSAILNNPGQFISVYSLDESFKDELQYTLNGDSGLDAGKNELSMITPDAFSLAKTVTSLADPEQQFTVLLLNSLR